MKARIATALLMMMMLAASTLAMAAPYAADADQERNSREEELYQDATDALDDGEWRSAAEKFRQVANMDMANAPAALHWLAYAQNKMGQRSDALTTLVDLQKRFPRSKWASDGKALELEIRQSAGQTVAPERVVDEELKLMALSSLMHTDPAKALPILEKVIKGNHSSKMKEKAIFVLSQSGSPKAMELLGQLARDGSRPELQAKALRNLGIMGGEGSRAVLADIYASTNDTKIKKTILKSYMISGDRNRLLALAKTEADPDLRSDAVQQLGLIGARNELAELYASESSVAVRKKIIQAMFLGGNADKLAELARNEKVLELRLTAIKNLGLMGGERSSQSLLSVYESDRSTEVKRAVVQGLFLQSNAKALVGLARKEKDPAMKKYIVSRLSLINSADSQSYLLELLNE